MAAPPCRTSGPRRSARQWAAHRAAASEGGGDGGTWLDGDAAAAIACDAAMAPVVTGDVNAAALEDLVRLCAELGKLRHAGDRDADAAAGGEPGAPARALPRPGTRSSRRSSARPRISYCTQYYPLSCSDSLDRIYCDIWSTSLAGGGADMESR